MTKMGENIQARLVVVKIVDYDGQSPSCSVSGAEKRFFCSAQCRRPRTAIGRSQKFKYLERFVYIIQKNQGVSSSTKKHICT